MLAKIRVFDQYITFIFFYFNHQNLSLIAIYFLMSQQLLGKYIHFYCNPCLNFDEIIVDIFEFPNILLNLNSRIVCGLFKIIQGVQ